MSLDLSLFTQVDTGDYIIVSPNTTMTGTGITGLLRNYAYYPYPTATFNGNFIHKFAAKVTLVSGNPVCSTWMLTKDIGDYQTLISQSYEFLVVQINDSSDWYLREFYGTGSSNVTDFTQLTSGDTWYWHLIERDETIGANGQLTMEIYSDEAMLNIVDTLSISLSAKLDLENLYAMSSYYTGTTASQNIIVKDFDLGDGIKLLRKGLNRGLTRGLGRGF